MDLSEHIESRSHSKTSQIDIKTNDQVQFPVTENIEFEQDGYKICITHDQNFLLALMKRRNRRSIHKSMRSDLIVREGTEEDLPDFYQLYLKTSQRQKFIPFKLDYFRNLWCVLKPFNSVQLFVAEYGGEKISALMSITFGNTLYTKHIGWSGKCSEFKPNHAVYWAALLWAKSKNYQYCDLDGIDIKTAQLLSKGKTLKVNQMQNPTFFKTGFGGELLLFPQTYVFVYNIFFRLACKLYLAKIFPTYFISRMMNIVRVSR